MTDSTTPTPDRDLALELVRVTEAAALASARWVGRGKKESADGAAVDAMRALLDTVDMDGTVIIGEGEKDRAPMLYNGESVGSGLGPRVDVAVDPVEGTTLVALGQPNALAVVGVAAGGSMYSPGPAVYMDQIVAGPELAEAIDLDAAPADLVAAVADTRGCRPEEVTVMILDRERHVDRIERLRQAGARVLVIPHGTVAAGVAAARQGTGVDIMMGIGGTPEAVITACALRCMGGVIQGRLWPRDGNERQAILAAGLEPERVLEVEDLVATTDAFFAATGITDGALLEGVRYDGEGATTESVVMRGRSGTVRIVVAHHTRDKLARFG